MGLPAPLGASWKLQAVSLQGHGRIQTVAPGVSAALLTTIAGLIVAIPSVIGIMCS